LSRASRRLAVFACGLLVVGLAACGGGGGGGGGPTEPPPPPPPGIVFTAQGVATANSVSLGSGTGTTANTLILEVRATQVTDLYGVAFDLAYPNAALQFVRATPGPLLANGSVQAVAATPGTLVVGGTHLGNVAGANGSGVVLTLEFSALAAGSGNFAFSSNTAFDSDGDAIAGVGWVAGSVVVTR
jgi:hypothetical protein